MRAHPLACLPTVEPATVLYADGGYRPDAGQPHWYFSVSLDGDVVSEERGPITDEVTSMVAEFRAVRAALRYLWRHQNQVGPTCVIRTDCHTIPSTISRRSPPRAGPMRRLFYEIIGRIDLLRDREIDVRVHHVNRAEVVAELGH